MSSAVPPPPATASFQEQFAALAREWRAQLPARLDDVRAGAAACRRAPNDAAALESLHRLAHTLAGSAGTFGLDALGLQARALEHELERLQALPAREPADFDGLQRGLEALLAAAPQG